MELHTLGVDGGYTQDDVIVLARIFTGWSVFFARPGCDPGDRFVQKPISGDPPVRWHPGE